MSEGEKDWLEGPDSMVVQMTSAENMFEDLLQATQDKLEIHELQQAAKEGGIPIATTPATATNLTPAEIAKTLRVSAKNLHRRLYEFHHKETLIINTSIARMLAKSSPKETKEELSNKIKETQISLEGLQKELDNRYRTTSKALTEIQNLAQQLPAIDNSPQGKAQNTLRAIVAILRSNGDIP